MDFGYSLDQLWSTSVNHGAVISVVREHLILHDLHVPLERPLGPLPIPLPARATLDPLGLAGVIEPR